MALLASFDICMKLDGASLQVWHPLKLFFFCHLEVTLAPLFNFWLYHSLLFYTTTYFATLVLFALFNFLRTPVILPFSWFHHNKRFFGHLFTFQGISMYTFLPLVSSRAFSPLLAYSDIASYSLAFSDSS